MKSLSRPSLCLVAVVGAFTLAAIVVPAAAGERPVPEETRAALEQQRQQLEGAISRADAAGVAEVFTTDAKLMVSDFDAIVGRDAIRQVWQMVLGSGAVARLSLEPKDLDGLGGEFPVETGTLTTSGRDGTAGRPSNYVIVWKHEDGAWKIHRDIASPRSAPAPTVDRVGFPGDYRTRLRQLSAPAFNPKLGVVQTTYGNEPAAEAATAGQSAYPYGSVLVMEFAQAVQDDGGRPMNDSAGHAQRGPVFRVDAMRREPGFGEAYGKNRAGEWEFVSYKVDGSYFTPPAGTASCAACHLNKAGAASDFVFLRMPVSSTH